MSWAAGSIRTIGWNRNLGANSVVWIELSRDGGASWATIASPVRNTAAGSGTSSWTVTDPVTWSALVRVAWLDGPTSHVSDVTFAVVAPVVTVVNVDALVPRTPGTNDRPLPTPRHATLLGEGVRFWIQ